MADDWEVNAAGLELAISELNNRIDDLDTTESWVVGTGVEYAPYQEYGTRHMAPNPFLRPSVRETIREMERIAETADTADELVRKLAFNIERGAKQRAPVDTGTLRSSIRAVRFE